MLSRALANLEISARTRFEDVIGKSLDQRPRVNAGESSIEHGIRVDRCSYLSVCSDETELTRR